MFLARNKIIPPKLWYHNPNIKNKDNKTVSDYLKQKGIPIPNEWYNVKMKNIEKKPEFI